MDLFTKLMVFSHILGGETAISKLGERGDRTRMVKNPWNRDISNGRSTGETGGSFPV